MKSGKYVIWQGGKVRAEMEIAREDNLLYSCDSLATSRGKCAFQICGS